MGYLEELDLPGALRVWIVRGLEAPSLFGIVRLVLALGLGLVGRVMVRNNYFMQIKEKGHIFTKVRSRVRIRDEDRRC